MPEACLFSAGRRAQFTQVVYAACSPSRPGMADAFAFWLPLPAVLKPEHLWTGKQVINDTDCLSLACNLAPVVFQNIGHDDRNFFRLRSSPTCHFTVAMVFSCALEPRLSWDPARRCIRTSLIAT